MHALSRTLLQIMVMLGALDLVRQRLRLDFLIEDLKADTLAHSVVQPRRGQGGQT